MEFFFLKKTTPVVGIDFAIISLLIFIYLLRSESACEKWKLTSQPGVATIKHYVKYYAISRNEIYSFRVNWRNITTNEFKWTLELDGKEVNVIEEAEDICFVKWSIVPCSEELFE